MVIERLKGILMKRRLAVSTKFILCFLFVAFLICFSAASKADTSFVINQITPDTSGHSLLLGGSGVSAAEVKAMKLINPDRLVIDINNAVLAGQKRTVQINNSDISEIKIAQFSVAPNLVRLVVTGTSADVINKIKVSKVKNSVLLSISESKTPPVATHSPVYKDRELQKQDNAQAASGFAVKNIKLSNNRIIVSGVGTISLAEPIFLDNPKRIVFDITGGALTSAALTQSINLSNGDNIRVGQFDKNTARIVVTSPQAESYKTIVSPDLQAIIISSDKNLTIKELPESTSVGDVQDIKVYADDAKTTRVLIVSSKPIIHNLNHTASTGDLFLEMYNLKQPRKELVAALKKTKQFKGIDFKTISGYPNGSKWVFPLYRTIKVETKLSLDGRRLEISMKDTVPDYIPPLIANTSKPTIVIDAGHGGQDPGAIGGCVLEKNLTILLAQKVKALLQKQGFNVIMTRDDDKTVSLKERTMITNDSQADIFVSIHINSSENSGVKGLETYYYTPQSQLLAQKAHEKVTAAINSPDRGIRTARFYVIRNTETPSILCEVGYISNESERNSMLSYERQNATAKAIADGVLNYVKSK